MSNHYFLYLYVLGMDARTMLNGVTYSKSLRLSNKARQVLLLYSGGVVAVLNSFGFDFREGICVLRLSNKASTGAKL